MKPILYTVVLVLSLLSTPVLAVKTGADPASAQEITDGDVGEFCRLSPSLPNDRQQDQNRESLRKLLTHIVSDMQPFTKIPEGSTSNFLKPQVYKFPQMIVAGVMGVADVKAFLPEALWPRLGEIEIEHFSLSSKDLHVREIGLAMGSVNPQKFLEAVVLMVQQPGAVIHFNQELPRAVHVDIDRVTQANPLFPILSAGQYRLTLFLKTMSVSSEWQAIHQFARGQSTSTGSFASQSSSVTSSLAAGGVQGGVAAQSASSPQQPVVGDVAPALSTPAPSATALSTAQDVAADAFASKSSPPAATSKNDDDDGFGDFEEVNIDDGANETDTGVKAGVGDAPAAVETAVNGGGAVTPAGSLVSRLSGVFGGSGGLAQPIRTEGNTGAVPDEFSGLRATVLDFHLSQQGLTTSTMPGQSIGGNPPVASAFPEGWDD